MIAGGGGGNGDESPPPPPPPCPWESPGCFKLGGQKVASREIVPDEFDYYLPQDTRCDSKAGGCACYAKPANPGAPPLQKNPDESSAACACIDVSDWNTKAQCCGDDELDCGRVSTGVLCSIDANFEQAGWIAASPNFGDIRYVGCDKSEYLSDGITWFKCDSTFWKRTIDNREYICIGRGRESIVECCGDSSCKSRVDGKRISTGQSASNSGNKTYYCRPDKKFVTDLDVPDSLSSDRTLITNNKATCEKAGLKWTGTKCCSEADDTEEYYNDEDGTGGCWNKEEVISIDFVQGTEESVANFNGVFQGCALEKTKYNTNNDNLLNLVDQHTSGPLIENHEYCFNDPEKNYFCSYSEKWMSTDGSDRTHLSFAPILVQQQGGCCSLEECWNGENCVENQKADPLAQPIGNNSRCIDGEWTNSLIKTSPDGTSSGFCPQSIEPGGYVADNYCENGKWSSRTKLVSLKLLKMKSRDYTLFCDSKENALNTLQYQTGSNEIVANVLVNLQTNNFCVLKTGSRIIVGASINKELEEVPASSFDVLGITECDFEEDDNQYHPCDSSNNKVWFNKKLKSFIYSATPIPPNLIPSEQDPLTSFEELVSNPIKGLINSLKRLISRPPFDESYIKGINKFDRLYISQQGNKFIIASMEGKNFKNAVIEYRNFETDVCRFVDQFNQAKKDISSGVSCRKEGNNYYVLAQGSQFTSINPDAIWPDLTSKLRLK
ncbi:hypothetical protein HYX05_04400 [Candidatus Woesearchaeota archaeon]|nr:hypothetical protein [Candidatus Woesearchaeota archaeon]